MHFAKILISLLLCAVFASSAGVSKVAVIDRSGYDDRDFNEASLREIIAFSKILAEHSSIPKDELQKLLNLKAVDEKSVERVTKRFWDRLFENYLAAAGENAEANDTAALRELALNAKIDEKRDLFYTDYLHEQLRLAALFPKISSEIDKFDANEISGDELKDGEFIFTFDDGPSGVNGNTDKLIKILREGGKNAIFFALGEKINERAAKKDGDIFSLYDTQCIASHGWSHRSHAAWQEWQKSVLDTENLLRSRAPSLYIKAFRPPYGQRKNDSAAFFAEQNIRVTLWNIDSQDWNANISAEQTADRTLTLMLLWRKGVILFHDIHAKAHIAVPIVFERTRDWKIIWRNCHKFL